MLVTAYRDDNDFSLKRKLTFLILYMLILEYTLFLLWSLEYEPWPNADAGHEPWPYKADD